MARSSVGYFDPSSWEKGCAEANEHRHRQEGTCLGRSIWPRCGGPVPQCGDRGGVVANDRHGATCFTPNAASIPKARTEGGTGTARTQDCSKGAFGYLGWGCSKCTMPQYSVHPRLQQRGAAVLDHPGEGPSGGRPATPKGASHTDNPARVPDSAHRRRWRRWEPTPTT